MGVAWSAVLCQRAEPGGCPRPIGLVNKSFSDEATRWTTFEREFYAWREGYESVRKWIDGFRVFTYFDHRNIERAESVLKIRRASKKLINWIADSQHLLAYCVRVWIDGKHNVLADVGSRNIWEATVAKTNVLPEQPIRDTI